jgi:hypothetical protein
MHSSLLVCGLSNAAMPHDGHRTTRSGVRALPPMSEQQIDYQSKPAGVRHACQPWADTLTKHDAEIPKADATGRSSARHPHGLSPAVCMDPRDLLWNHPPPSRPNRKPKEPLWRQRVGHITWSAELRFLGKSFGWEAEIFRQGELAVASTFRGREEAVQWAKAEQEHLHTRLP